ncbi:MAG: Gfo/Idh/MocA family oxidoreductase [Chloroflexales bacterium]|nr:Gfo/Idh/MocA family oxidoreductase [Chloroflexales bacterium]
MSQTLGIGLVGYGAIGRLHATVLQLVPQIYPSLQFRPQLRAICAGGQRSQANAFRDYPDIPQIEFPAMLADPQIEIIAICTPTGAHAEQVRLALSAGKHVMCEKPLTVEPAISASLVNLAATQKRLLVLNHHFRRIPALAEAQRRIIQGQMGDAISAHLRYFRSSNVRADRPLTWRFAGTTGGVLVDLGSHLIDLCHFLFQSPIVRVQAELRTVIAERPDVNGVLTTVESDDVAWLTAQLANGMRVTIEASKMVPGAADDIRVEAYGTAGSIVFDMQAVNTLQMGTATHPAAMQRTQIWNQQQPAANLPGAETPTGLMGWHAAAWESLLASLAGEVRDVCDGAAGLLVDQVITAARMSAANANQWCEVVR